MSIFFYIASLLIWPEFRPWPECEVQGQEKIYAKSQQNNDLTREKCMK